MNTYTSSYCKCEGNELKLKLSRIPELLRYRAGVTPDKTAFVFLSTQARRETFTWREIYDHSYQCAKSLVEFGIKQKDIVAIAFRTSPEWLFVNFGSILAGAIPMGISFTYKDGSDVIALMSRLQTCSALFLDPGEDNDIWNIFKKLIDTCDKDGNLKSAKIPSLSRLVCLHEPEESRNTLTLDKLRTLANDDTQLPEVAEDDVVGLFQTSGSTGVPKIIVHTHRSLSYFAHYNTGIGLIEEDVLFNDRPFNWLGGYPKNIFTGETRVTRSGNCKVPEDLAQFIHNAVLQERCTFLFSLPPLLYDILQKGIPPDWPVRILSTGGQPIAKHFTSCIDKGLTKTLNIIYGSSEANCVLSNLVSKTEDFIEFACGVPSAGAEIKIVGDDGTIVPPYTRGEIYVRSEGTFKGYFNDDEKTRAVLTEDGWYKTDDLGYMTEKGIFYVEGRKSDMILSGGFNVAPAILEAVLKQYPGVKDAVIVPIPHELMYQVVCACFIPQPGSDVTEDGLHQYCREVHADKHCLFTVLPSYYLKFEAFPLTTTGKTSRKLLTVEAVHRIKQLS